MTFKLSEEELHLGETCLNGVRKEIVRLSVKDRMPPRAIITAMLLEAVGLAAVTECLEPGQVRGLFEHAMSRYATGEEEKIH